MTASSSDGHEHEAPEFTAENLAFGPINEIEAPGAIAEWMADAVSDFAVVVMNLQSWPNTGEYRICDYCLIIAQSRAADAMIMAD